MKKKRAKTVHELLGPDGKQLDVAKYRKPPEKIVLNNQHVDQYLQHMMQAYYGDLGGFVIGLTTAEPPKKQGPSLEERVAADLESIEYPEDWKGGEELPQPDKDLSTYADALASARAKCDHTNLINTLYNREWQCADCEKYFDLREIQALARRQRGGW